ncbi:MAG: tocopherol cyclase [Limisphaerales bacterium]|jgi:tocopherol cyclase
MGAFSNFNKRFNSIWTPSVFQGWGKRRGYFEGWYFKIISKDEKHAYAIIPGIALDEKASGADSHSFIQIMDGINNKADYLRFAVDDFSPSYQSFELELASNKFSDRQISLDLPNCKGKLSFSEPVKWPVKWHSPGIMGWYAFVPFMECYHGIVSMNSTIEGSLEVDGTEIDFTGGKAYLEKDWGVSFPSSWIWMQSNHFEQDDVSINISVANIPWLFSSFVGFIAWVWIDGTLYPFTTYSGAKMTKTAVKGNKINLELVDNKYHLSVEALGSKSAELVAPIKGIMEGRVEESMTAVMQVCLKEKRSGKIIFEGTGNRTGLEVAGNYKELLK